MTAPFGIRAALEYRNVEPGKGKIWGAIKVEALGPSLEAERAPLAVALVVDVSGSMEGEPLEQALRSCKIMSELMGQSEQLAIVTFSTHASVLCGLTTLDERGRAQVRASLQGARAQGNTNLHAGLGVAAGVLQRARAPCWPRAASWPISSPSSSGRRRAFRSFQLLPASLVRFGSDGATASLGDVFKDEARAFAVELELDLGDRASGRLLEVVIDGRTPDGALHQVSAMLELDVRAGERIANHDAQREVLVLQADAARGEARVQADRRSTPAAVSILREMLARIDALPGFAPNDGSILAELREQMEDEAASYERRATDMERSHQRKSALAYKAGAPAFSRGPRRRTAIAACLTGVDGPVRGRSVQLWSENIIGRSAGCDIVVDDVSLSRNHARIQWLDDHFLLVDLGPTHGTSVNGQSIQSARLADGDLVKLGEAVFRFELVTPAQLHLPDVP